MEDFLKRLKAIREHWSNLQACDDRREAIWIGDEIEAQLDGLIDEVEAALSPKQ
jgi:hypothetical protein